MKGERVVSSDELPLGGTICSQEVSYTGLPGIAPHPTQMETVWLLAAHQNGNSINITEPLIKNFVNSASSFNSPGEVRPLDNLKRTYRE